MRNLKKLLALTLAMVMAFSLMLTANAAVKYDDYTDKDSITDEFTEAVQVLTGLEVMQGDEKGFRPSDKITRAEAAAVIYRAVTGDVTNKQNDLYKDYGTFTDVKSDDWFAGYVGYCQNAGYIKGTSPTTFNPYGQVTGYEVLAMILRAVGYGKNNEFTGSSWQVNVAALARQLGVTRNVTAAHMEQTLNMAAPREVVADLVFMTIATVPTVTYTPALAYNDKQSVAGADSNIYNITLGQQVFGLFHDTTWQVIDNWGNPGYRWRNNGVWNGSAVTGPLTGKGYMIPANHPWYTASPDTKTVATIKQAPDYETTVQVKECDVAAALEDKGFDDEEIFNLYVNQKTVLTDSYRVVAVDTVTKVGGQGRLTKVYFEMENPWFTDITDNHDMVVTMVDTMLARVNRTIDAKLDPAGHIITPAQMEVTIYDGMNTTFVAGAADPDNAQSERIISKPSDSKDNWEYSVGDHILLNAWTNKVTNGVSGTVDFGNNKQRPAANQTALEEAAFETNKVVSNRVNGTTGAFNGMMTQGTNVWVDKVADSKTGKQTTLAWNTGKHNVDGTEYDDQICLFLDRAGRTTNTTFTWYFDNYGNLIGIGDAHATQFGVITSIYSAQSQGESDTTGGVKAIANVRYTDGTTGTVEIDRFLMSWGTSLVAANANSATNTDYSAVPGTTMDVTANQVAATACTPASDNTIELVPVFDTSLHSALTTSAANPTFNRTAAGVAATGWLYISPSTTTNTNAHFSTGATGNWDNFGILYDNLFRFSVADDNSMVATEVAGSYTNNGNQTNANLAFANTNVNFTRMANIVVDDGDGNAATKATGTLFKSLGYMALQNVVNANGTAAGTNYVYLDANSQILVRLGTTTLTAYTLDTLPGNVTIADGAEVDWADVDGDGRADVVYIGGASIPNTITYGLFYYNGGVANWDGTSRTGTIAGYLNGEATTINVNNWDRFNTIQNSNDYDAHLFALQFTDGVVSNVMVAENQTQTAAAGTNVQQRILTTELATVAAAPVPAYAVGDNRSGVVLDFDTTPATADNRANNIRTSGSATSGWTWAGATEFGLGASFNNPYTTTTEAVYYHDENTSTGLRADQSNVVYTRTSLGDRIDVTGAGADNYWIAPGCKIVGELSWLNTYVCDVTMVYDAANANAVTELYIAMDPDITPVAPADPGDMTAAKKTLTITNLAQNGVATVQVTYTSTAALTAGAAVAPGTDFTSIVLNIERVNEFGQWENFASQTWATGSLATTGNDVALAPALNNIQTVGTLLGGGGQYRVTLQLLNGTTLVAWGQNEITA